MTSENLDRFTNEFLGPLPRYAAQQGFTIHALLQLEPEERLQAEEMLLQTLEAGNTDVRILMGLEELRPERAAMLLERCLEDGKLSPVEVVHAALALWKIKRSPQVLAYITGVLDQTQDDYHKVEAINALANFHCREVVDRLKKLLADENAAVRSQAMRAILSIYGLLTGSGWPPLVTDMMVDDSDQWQTNSAELEHLVGHLPLPPCY